MNPNTAAAVGVFARVGIAGCLATAASFGCHPASSADTATVVETVETGWSYHADPPVWSADEAVAHLTMAVAMGLPEPTTLIDAMLAMVHAGYDGNCPGQDSLTFVGSFSGCESQLGYLYAGVTSYEEDGSGDYSLSSDCYFIDPQGEVFQCAGAVERRHTDDAVQFEIAGTWGYPPAAGWVGEVPDLAIWVDVGDDVSLSGGYGPDDSLYFEDVVAQGSGVTGRLWVRDPSQAWYVLDYGDDGDACGTLSWDDQPVGSGCVPLDDAVATLRSDLGEP